MYIKRMCALSAKLHSTLVHKKHMQCYHVPAVCTKTSFHMTLKFREFLGSTLYMLTKVYSLKITVCSSLTQIQSSSTTIKAV
jgi:hypothetical protein